VVPDDAEPSSTAFYEKGACVNRMLAASIGQPLWYAALAAHIQAHKWSNPSLDDLLGSFRGALPMSLTIPFEKRARGWLLQPGMPLVTISLASAGSSVELRAEQRPSAPSLDQSLRWWVPLELRFTPDDAAQPAWATRLDLEDEAALPLPPAAAAAAASSTLGVEANYNFSAFVLVNYSDPAQWKRITTKMATPGFPPVTRQQLQKQLTYLSSLEQLAGPSLGHLVRLIASYGDMVAAAGVEDLRSTTAEIASTWLHLRRRSVAAAAAGRCLLDSFASEAVRVLRHGFGCPALDTTEQSEARFWAAAIGGEAEWRDYLAAPGLRRFASRAALEAAALAEE